MNVKRLLKLVRKVFSLLLLFEKLLLKQVNFTFEIRNALGFFLGINQLSFTFFNLVFEVPDILHLLLIVNFTFFKGRLLYLDLLVKKVQLFVSLN